MRRFAGIKPARIAAIARSGSRIRLGDESCGGSMAHFRSFCAAATAVIAMFTLGTAWAMPVQVFDRMSVQDRGNYISVMIAGAKKVLTEAGQPEAVEKIEKLFTTVLPGDQVSVGSAELSLNLAAVTKAEADNLVKDPNAKPLPVELAMI